MIYKSNMIWVINLILSIILLLIEYSNKYLKWYEVKILIMKKIIVVAIIVKIFNLFVFTEFFILLYIIFIKFWKVFIYLFVFNSC